MIRKNEELQKNEHFLKLSDQIINESALEMLLILLFYNGRYNVA